MKKAKEVKKIQKKKMEEDPRYKALLIDIGTTIDEAILENKDRATIKLTNDELPFALLIAANYGYGWQYIPPLGKTAQVSFEITW